ncbi:hypothetical protein IKG07_01270 [Candidatus Saccharibacteria bacterium]|nr:hypothetical protein [Candidatus Saccharibacteria bacterium]
MKSGEKAADPIGEISTSTGNSDPGNRWRRFLDAEEIDKRHTESVRYRNEIGKTAEEIRKDKKEIQKMGKTAFQQMLNKQIENIKNGGV